MDKEIKAAIFIFLGFILFMVIGWITWSYFEARFYNDVTGRQVTTIQAMFINLRVIECAENDK